MKNDQNDDFYGMILPLITMMMIVAKTTLLLRSLVVDNDNGEEKEIVGDQILYRGGFDVVETTRYYNMMEDNGVKGPSWFIINSLQC